MKTKKGSRILALLLSLVMLLGSLPTAFAEGEGAIIKDDAYEQLANTAAFALYDSLMAAEDLKEYRELIKTLFEENLDALEAKYGADATETLMAHQDELLAEFQAKLQAMQLPSEIIYISKGYTNAAPMLQHSVVSAAPIATYGLRTMAIDDTPQRDNGLELRKYLSDAGDKLYLEAWTTGSKVTSVEVSSKPTDIIIVIDQSGSMKYDFKNNTYSWQAYTNGTNANNLTQYNNGNLWYQIGDDYVAVTVTTEVVDTEYQYTAYSTNTNNRTYYNNYRDNLYELLSDGTYVQIGVVRSGQSGNRKYTYTFADGTSITSSGSDTKPYSELGRTLYGRATADKLVYRYSYVDANGTRQYIGTDSEGASTVFGTTFYQRVVASSTQEPRLDALVRALNTFVDNVEDDAMGKNGVYDAAGSEDNDDVDHRIAIVGFASNTSTYKNTELLTGVTISSANPQSIINQNGTYYYPDGNGHNGAQYGSITTAQYTAALQDVTTSAGRTSVANAIAALTAHGGTQPQDGMTMAQQIFANDPYDTEQNPYDPEERGRVVILFTDGQPDSTTAGTSAINIANTLRDTYDAVVYSVGIFEGADATSAGSSSSNVSTASYGNYFLQNVSDNKGTPPVNGGTSYYLSASNSEELNTIFSTISSSSVSGGALNESLTTTTVIKDIFSSYFELPANAQTSSIKVYTDAYGAYGANGTGAFKNDWQTMANAQVSISADAATGEDLISVSNFDYTANWVGTETAADGTITYRGQKLIIEIPIAAKEDFLGGKNVPTNDTMSAVYTSSTGTMIERFPEPDTDVPLKAITPVINDDHIYLSNQADLLRLISKYNNTSAYHEYTLNVNGTNKTFTVDGVNNAYVDIVYTFADSEGKAIATYTIPAGQTTGTLAVAGSTDVLLTDDATYSITCTVYYAGETTNGAALKAQTGTVYVYKPVLTFKDSAEEYLDTMVEADDDTYFAANNYLGVDWERADGTKSTATGITMNGNPPLPVLTYAPKTNALMNSAKQVVSKNDVAVNVQVALNGTDYTSHASSIRNACQCSGLDKACTHKEAVTAKAMGNDPEFVVHVFGVVGELKIGKKVSKPDDDNIANPVAGEEFTFDFTLTFDNDELASLPMQKYKVKEQENDEPIGDPTTVGHAGTLTLKAGEYVVISEIPAGAFFVVKEADATYYTVQGESDRTMNGTIKPGDVVEANFENIYHKRKTGDLTITKNLIDASFTEGTRTFNFNVKLNDTDTFAQQQFGEWAAAKGLTVTETSEVVGDKTVTKKSVTVPITVDASTKKASVTLTDITLAEKKGNLPAGTYGLPVGEYIVTEAAQTAYYQSTTSDPADGTVNVTADGTAAVTVTNTADLYSAINVEKIWEDQNNASGQRPTGGIVVTLTGTANDEVVYRSTIENWTDAGNEWTRSWTNVPKKTLDGTAITYTVSEQPVTNYSTTITGDVTKGFTVTNTIERTSMTIEKQGAQANDEIFIMKVQTESAGLMEVVIVGNGSITINNLMVGEQVTVTEDMSWAWRYNATYDPAQTITLTANAANNMVTVTNTRKTDQWIDGNTSAENIFGTTPKPNVTTRPANNQ